MTDHSHLGGNAFSVKNDRGVRDAYQEWLANEMEEYSNDGIDLDEGSIPVDGYPMNVGFYRNFEQAYDVVEIELSDKEILQHWIDSTRKG